jgi:hypothetical protein
MTNLSPNKIESMYFISDIDKNNVQADSMNEIRAVSELPERFAVDKRYFANVTYHFNNYILNTTTYIGALDVQSVGDTIIGGVNVAGGFAIANLDGNVVANSHIEPMPVLIMHNTRVNDILDIVDQWAHDALIAHIEQQDNTQATIEAFNQDEADRQDYLNDSTEFSTHSEV